MESANATRHCPDCGYDLRAAEADGEGKLHCSECGGRFTESQARRAAAELLIALPLWMRLRRRHFIVSFIPTVVFGLSVGLMTFKPAFERPAAILGRVFSVGMVGLVLSVAILIPHAVTLGRWLSVRRIGGRGRIRELAEISGTVLLLNTLAWFCVGPVAAGVVLLVGLLVKAVT